LWAKRKKGRLGVDGERSKLKEEVTKKMGRGAKGGDGNK